MLIDWFTVGAQAVNFLVLVWLLRRFLYGPILAAVDARERRVASDLAQARSEREAAALERLEYEQRKAQLDRDCERLLQEAAAQAQSERQRTLEKTRRDADTLAAQRRSGLQSEVLELQRTLSLRAGEEVFALARRALLDLSDSDLEERIALVFARRLRALDGDARARMRAAVQADAQPPCVHSAFSFSPAQREMLSAVMAEVLGARAPRFEQRPELIAGIELTTGGQKVSWSVDGYLDEMRERLEQELSGPAKAPSTGATEPR